MSNELHNAIWKTSPFVRLLIPLIAGILLQWYLQLSLPVLIIAFVCFLLDFILIRFLPLSIRYKSQAFHGAVINLVLISLGALITWQKDIRHDNNWFGNYYKDGDYLIVRIDEPPIEKEKSNKANGYVQSIIHNDYEINCKGKILLYFSKEPSMPALRYGDVVLIHNNLQSIKNSGNPGEFNYERYAAFRQTFHTVFLKKDDWILLNEKNINHFRQFIFSSRANILSILRNNIKGGNDEVATDEALLIGYTSNLDKELVQAYSNAGVPQIIAISGMSLWLIYIALLWVFNKTPFIKRSLLLKTVIVLSCLWIFALITGGSASVLRSAIVFTFIGAGKLFNKKSSAFNSLAASAFLILCYNPYFLWDVSFQLSYLVIISILIFYKKIYNLIYVKNKWLNKLWECISITLAVQVLTFPICIYYFHQFPVFFLITNIVAIPLSIIILFAEVFLLAFSKISLLGIYFGKIIIFYTFIMNKFILWINSLARIDDLQLSIFSTWILYAIIIFISAWLLNKNKIMLNLSLVLTLLFTAILVHNNFTISKQNKIVVYNMPKYQAIDIICGNNYQFVGDSILQADVALQNNNLKPTRTALQLAKKASLLKDLFNKENFYQFKDKRMLLVDDKTLFAPSTQKTDIDIIIISKNPTLYIAQLASVFNCKQYIFDASNSLWKIAKWKEECEKLHLPCYSIPDQGAFVLNLQ